MGRSIHRPSLESDRRSSGGPLGRCGRRLGCRRVHTQGDNMTMWLVTGASRGFGLEIVKGAIARGDQAAPPARRPDALRTALPDAGDSMLALPLDVTSSEQAKAAVNETVERFGRINVLVNKAGRGLLGAVEEVSEAEARAVFDVNVFGLLTVTRAVL